MKYKAHVSLAGSSTNSPFWVFLSTRGQKLPKHDKNQQGQDTHYLSVCTKSEASIYFLKPWMQINDFDLFLAVK